MDIVHFRKLFPGVIPTDVINMIYYFLGIQTPTCKIMSKYIQDVSMDLQRMRDNHKTSPSKSSYRSASETHYGFNNSIDTLWNALFWWHFPKFLSKNGQEKTLTRAETDLSIAYHQLLQALCKNKITKAAHSQTAMDGVMAWHQMHIADLQERISEKAKMECLEIDRFEREQATVIHRA